jgi:uncharacterized protein (DUF2062 family)
MSSLRRQEQLRVEKQNIVGRLRAMKWQLGPRMLLRRLLRIYHKRMVLCVSCPQSVSLGLSHWIFCVR